MDIGLFTNLIIGILFVAIGNYLPKCKQNYTVGIRLPWALSSEENWNRTHRFASWIWIFGGVVFIFNAFLQLEWILAIVIILGIINPPLFNILSQMIVMMILFLFIEIIYVKIKFAF